MSTLGVPAGAVGLVFTDGGLTLEDGTGLCLQAELGCDGANGEAAAKARGLFFIPALSDSAPSGVDARPGDLLFCTGLGGVVRDRRLALPRMDASPLRTVGEICGSAATGVLMPGGFTSGEQYSAGVPQTVGLLWAGGETVFAGVTSPCKSAGARHTVTGVALLVVQFGAAVSVTKACCSAACGNAGGCSVAGPTVLRASLARINNFSS